MGKRSDASTRIEFVGGPMDGQWETIELPPPPVFEVPLYLPHDVLSYQDRPKPVLCNLRIGLYQLAEWVPTGQMVYRWEGEVLA